MTAIIIALIVALIVAEAYTAHTRIQASRNAAKRIQERKDARG